MVNQDTFERKIADSSSFVNLNFPSYKKILVPHDGSEMSDISLRHAIYISKISNAEIIIINVIEEDIISPSTLLSFLKKEEEGGLIQSKEDLRNTMEGAIKKMLENRVKDFDKLEIHLSYKILAGKPPDEIIKFSEESNIDLIVMASSRISSTIRVIGSTVRKVIDSTRKPVLVIHE
jgi:nucleotide-binding universal stress UspA family protein